MTERGKFITIEGADGTGKSTQATRLAKHLNETGHQSFLTREPGGCPGAERIRSLLLDSHAKWEPDAEVLLHFAARRQHIQDAIIPFLDRGYWVVSDRFYDSTRAYQQFGQGASSYLINSLIIDLPVHPDLTIVLDISDDEADRRLHARRVVEHIRKTALGDPFDRKTMAAAIWWAKARFSGEEKTKAKPALKDRYERMDSAFHTRVRDGYRQIARRESLRCVLIDACRDIDAVHRCIIGSMRARGLIKEH